MKIGSSQTPTSAWQKMALVFLGLFLSLVLLETGMHLGGFVLTSIQEYGNLRSVKQKGAYRILCLGESTTQGQYPYLLEQVLNKRNIGVHFSVIDQGRPGANTSTLLKEIESNLAEYHPEMVVTMMGINDQGKHMPLETPTISAGMLFIRSLRIYKLARFLELHLRAKVDEFFHPRDDNAYLALGQQHLDAGELFLAEDSFMKAIKLNPINDNARLGLGRIFLNQGKYLQAENSYRKAIELNPVNDNAYNPLGFLYLQQGRLSQAENSLKRAAELNPKNSHAYFLLGGLFQKQGKYHQAEDLFMKSIELNPKDARAYAQLGWLYQVHGEFAQAEHFFIRAQELDPKKYDSLKESARKPEAAKDYAERTSLSRYEHYRPVTINNYRKLKEIVNRKGIKLVCVQYPMLNVEPLKRIFMNDKGVIFVDNEGVFKKALKEGDYKDYFIDMFAGDFGHCTVKGNTLLARNIADVILKQVFNR